MAEHGNTDTVALSLKKDCCISLGVLHAHKSPTYSKFKASWFEVSAPS